MRRSKSIEGADRKEQRKTKRKREREIARPSLSNTPLILYLSYSLIPSSSCTVHSFVRPLPPPSLSLSFIVSSLFLSHSLPFILSLSYTQMQIHTFIHLISLWPPPVSPTLPLSRYSHLFFSPFLLFSSTLCRSLTRACRSYSFSFLHPAISFSSRSSHQSDTSAAL